MTRVKPEQFYEGRLFNEEYCQVGFSRIENAYGRGGSNRRVQTWVSIGPEECEAGASFKISHLLHVYVGPRQTAKSSPSEQFNANFTDQK
jgi:hypothetical protein